MKKIGFILDKNSKKIFILPDEVRQLTTEGVVVNLLANYGQNIKITDDKYIAAGAKIFSKANDVIDNSDIICKPNAFVKNELKFMNGKIAITMANYLNNVDMLYFMLTNNVKSYAWNSLTHDNNYVFFPELEKIKAKYVIQKMTEEMKNRKYTPRILILNATWAAYEIIYGLLAHNMNVTLCDDDLIYCNDLKNTPEIKKICKAHHTHLDIRNAKFETLVKSFPTHDGFINTCIDPFNRTKTRITDEMAKSMLPGSLLIDESCENGYAFHFQKKFATTSDMKQKIGQTNYICVADICELFPQESSQIISSKSINYLLLLANDKTDDFADILITKNCNCVNKDINHQLKLL